MRYKEFPASPRKREGRGGFHNFSFVDHANLVLFTNVMSINSKFINSFRPIEPSRTVSFQEPKTFVPK